MLKDQCILVDDGDKVIGHASKAAAHRFEGQTPTGLLHRAFSVFLFDPAGAGMSKQPPSYKHLPARICRILSACFSSDWHPRQTAVPELPSLQLYCGSSKSQSGAFAVQPPAPDCHIIQSAID